MVIKKFFLIYLILMSINKTALNQKEDNTLKEKEENQPFFNKQFKCDISTQRGICLMNGEKILYQPAKQENLLIQQNFNKIIKDDRISMEYDIGYGGFGQSSKINDQNSFEIPNFYFPSKKQLNIPNSKQGEQSYTIQFWLFIEGKMNNQEQQLRFCPIFEKGKNSLSSQEFKSELILHIDRQTNKLVLLTRTTKDKKFPLGEELMSNSKLQYSQWYSISIILLNTEQKLYINGVLDNKKKLVGELKLSKNSLNFGDKNKQNRQCQFDYQIDKFKVFNKELDESQILAESSSLRNNLPFQIKFGCSQCTIQDAIDFCKEGFQICTTDQLVFGALKLSKSLGWNRNNKNIWSLEAIDSSQMTENQGLGICCK